MRCVLVPPLCMLLSLAAGTHVSAQQEREREPIDSGIEEQVEIVLIEFKLLVTDKQGRPITDLRPEEVSIFEGRRPQKLAFVESWLTADSAPELAPVAEIPTPVYSATGEESVPEPIALVPPPKPVRRVLFIFDIRNSRIRVREEWREAAMEWVRTNMTEQDMASIVVLVNYPRWILQSASDKNVVLRALESVDLYTDTPNRSRREEVTDLLNDLNFACIDPSGGPRKDAARDPQSSPSPSDTASCVETVIKPYIAQWASESDESILALRQLTGQLASVPGRKAVILFSEGIIPDPTHVAINAVLSIWGTSINFQRLESSLRRNVFNEITGLHRVASASDVVYFTMDTRPISERGYSNEVEMQVSQARGQLGINPWSEMYESTRSTLSALAWATGGRPFYGSDDLKEDVETAAASFYGVYNVGYYRSDLLNPGKLKVKIARKAVRWQRPDNVDFLKHEALRTRLELAVARPSYSGDGNRQTLPIAVMVLYDLLPLRRGAGGRGCQLGIFLQAQRPDGSVAAERLDTTIVLVPKDAPDDLKGRYYDYRTSLELEPGEYRVRARLSDDFNEIRGDTFIDLTLGDGTIVPGFVEAESKTDRATRTE